MSNSDKNGHSRKSFLKKLGLTSAGFMGAPFIISRSRGKSRTSEIELSSGEPRKYSKNDRIQIALIGAGWMGQIDAEVAAEVEGVELVAACDLYEGRLSRCREIFGDDIFTTKDYREVLNRSDVDAVVVGTPDHWHDTIAIDALNSGKAVYLEKPMVQHIDEAYDLIEAEKDSGLPLIIGSQSTSSLVQQKAAELFRQGAIGKLNFVEAYRDRFSHLGAWQYSIPASASPENIDWEMFLKDLPSIPFNAKHFFRWRNYRDYGTGVAGDLFVHLFAGIHQITGSNGPNRIAGMGGLRFWEDGRDAEDVMMGLYNYPETESHPAFNCSLRVNFADGSGGGSLLRLVGTEGEMELRGGSLILRKASLPDRPGISTDDFGEDIRKEYEEFYEEQYPESRPRMIEPDEFIYRSPEGYNDRHDHFVNFFDAIRHGGKIFQDGTYGLRSAAPALATNISHREQRIVNWDPENLEVS